ncbi:hypothetical protein Aperf_G00000087368 [Anoplocephala perfoliata]
MQTEPKKLSEDVLKLLYALFISNCPSLTKNDWNSNFTRIFTELEFAHWYYIDNYVTGKADVGIDMYGMCKAMFERFPNLLPGGVDWIQKYNDWRSSRIAVPTGSAIILDEDFEMVLLVQGFNNKRWTFPGGKVAENESLRDCAVREVMEEVGLDVEHRIDDTLYMEVCVGGTRHRAHIVEGFPRTRNLRPSTKNEIEVITWFNLSRLNTDVILNSSSPKSNSKRSEFLLVAPFIAPLQMYVHHRKLGLSPGQALRYSWKPQSRRQNSHARPPERVSAFSPPRQHDRKQSVDQSTGPRNSKQRSKSQVPMQNRLLRVDPSPNSNNIFGGQVSINADVLMGLITN